MSGRSSYGRQSYRSKYGSDYSSSEKAALGDDSSYQPTDYRRASADDELPGRDINADVQSDAKEQQDAQRDRVVEAALQFAKKHTPEPSNSQELVLRVGDRVEHPSFGAGVIIDVKGEGDRAEATINFSSVGTKHLSLAWAPLKKIG